MAEQLRLAEDSSSLLKNDEEPVTSVKKKKRHLVSYIINYLNQQHTRVFFQSDIFTRTEIV